MTVRFVVIRARLRKKSRIKNVHIISTINRFKRDRVLLDIVHALIFSHKARHCVLPLSVSLASKRVRGRGGGGGTRCP